MGWMITHYIFSWIIIITTVLGMMDPQNSLKEDYNLQLMPYTVKKLIFIPWH